MRITAISDVHYGDNRNKPCDRGVEYVNTFGLQFSDMFRQLLGLIGNSDLIVNLGDAIVDLDPKTDIERYSGFLEQFKDIGKDVIHVTGNHDVMHLPASSLEEMTCTKRYFSRDVGGVHHVVLFAPWDQELAVTDEYGSRSGQPGAIDAEQIVWLKEDIHQSVLPTVVYIHFPCDEQSFEDNYYFNNIPDEVFVKDKKKLREIFEEQGNVRLVVSGHTHFYHKEELNGVLYLTVPSFTENDGNGKPCGEYVEITLTDSNIDCNLKRIYE